jgi:hypothetical protein
VHIYTKKVNFKKTTNNRSQKLKHLIQNLASAGTTITELCFHVEEDESCCNGRVQGYTVEKYIKVLVECSSLLSHVTHFGFDNTYWGEADPTTQGALEAFITFLESLDKLTHVNLNVEFRKDVDPKALARLRTIYLKHLCACLSLSDWGHYGSLVAGK